MLSLDNLTVSVATKTVVRSLSLQIKPGEIHALMGPNGSGKTSLAYTLAGHPAYQVTSGSISLNQVSLLPKTPHERAQLGLFLAFQSPVTIPGVSVQNFLKSAYEQTHCAHCLSGKKMGTCNHLTVLAFRQLLHQHAQTLGINPELLSRSLNDGFSGGEKKRIEILQLLTLKPKLAVLDESDSGLDVDSIKLVAKATQQLAVENQTGILVITHYTRLFEYLKPTHVHLILNGRIVKSAGPELITIIDQNGYSGFKSIG